jgi:AraC-like DNA-binding protein
VGVHDNLVHIFYELVYVWTDYYPFYSIKARALILFTLHHLFELVINTTVSLDDVRTQQGRKSYHSPIWGKTFVWQMDAMTGFNAIYFGALLRRETGMSMNCYLIKTCIRNTENMFRSGRHTTTKITKRYRYNDRWHFYKQFKEICGIPPVRFYSQEKSLLGEGKGNFY